MADTGELMSNLLLQVEVADGQFDFEAVVTFKSADGETVSTITPRTFLYTDRLGRELLQVKLLVSSGSEYLVEVPGDLYGATRDVLVPRDMLEPVSTAE